MMEIRKDDQPGFWTHLPVFFWLFTKQKHLSRVSQTDDLHKEVVGISRKHGRVFHVVKIDHLMEKKLLVNMKKHFSNTADENEQNLFPKSFQSRIAP